MAKKIYDEKIDKHVNWGGDDSTGNLPVAGSRVQEFIKEQLEGKAGIFYYDTTNNRYIVFSDVENRDVYLADPTKTDLIIGTFDAPFNYSAHIALSTPTYVAILADTKNNYIDFTFDTVNKSEQSVGEDVVCTYTFIKGGIKKVVTEKYRYGQAVHFNIDDYISIGTNTITVGVVGQNTLAATTIGITYQVIDLQLSDTYDISQAYNLTTNPTVTAAIPYTVSGYGTKIIEWHLDGVMLDYIKVEDEIVDVSTTRTKYISLSNLSQGIHTLQYRAYTMVDGDKFYSNILYRDLIVVTGVNKNPIIAVGATIPVGNDIITGNLQLFGITQFIPYELNFAVYNPSSTASTNAIISINSKAEATILAHNGETSVYSLRPTEYGVKTMTITTGPTVYTIILNIAKSSTSLEPVTDGLLLDLSALGKSNNDANKEEWTYGIYSATFSGFNWNKTSGWNNNRLFISSGAYVDINLSPLSPAPTTTGKTLEFEFSTASVNDDSTVICDLRNTSGTGLLITASEVKLTSAGGAEISTKFKSGENIRVAFVINKKTGVANRGLVFIYVNGICSGAVNYSSTDNFTSSSTLRIGNTNQADIELKALRFYNTALTSDQILNNYILYRDTTEALLTIYDKNNIYEEGTQNFSVDKLSSQCPVFIFTGDIPALENTTDKNKTIYVDLEYINMQHPEKSFTGKGIRLRPQGTSSMGYPKKNFRPYTGYGQVWDNLGNIMINGLYAFKEGAQPVNVWCLKADYAESSGTHNTGIARLWNQVMTNAQLNGEYVLRTAAQKAATAVGYLYDVRTTVDGFPCNVFYRLTADSELVYIGKYNFNNDKSTESVFGFRDIPGFDNSKMQCWELLNNGNHLALFQDMNNFDSEWDQAYEARYPDGSTNVTNLKIFSAWVVSTKNNLNKFKTEKWAHLDVYKVAAYYIYLMRFGAVDQVVKNAMLTSEDGIHFYFINYDNDTINAVRNDGLLIYNYDIDRQTVDTSFSALVYAYAGHDSTLWNNLEADEEFMQIVSQVDNALYMAGLTYEKTIDMFDNQQSGKWCERIYNQDAQYKYILPYTDSGINNLFMLQGSRSAHRRWWLSHRFDLLDSKFISGAYKAKSIEFKAANAPAGLQFSLTSGNNIYYGYGLNNVPIETGVRLAPTQSHTFITKQVINVGDPVRIYSAINIQELDIHNFISYLSTLNVAEVYNDSVGTKLKKLVMGVNTSIDNRRNTSLSVISGLAQATRLEYLDISGYQAINNLDLSKHVNLTTLKAYESGLTGAMFANGGLVSYLEFPETMQAISLESLPNLTASGLKVENEWKSVYSISIKNCDRLQASYLIFNWYSKKTTEDSRCSLILEGIEWYNVDASVLISLGNIKTAGGTLSIKGIIHLTAITPEQVNMIKTLFGENCFNADNEIHIIAPDGVFITGPSEILEGNAAQYTATVFSDYKGRVEYWLVKGLSEVSSYNDVSINKATGLMTTELTNSPRNIKVRAKHLPTQGSVVIADLSVSVKKRLYPTAGVIDGPTRMVAGDTPYALTVSNPAGDITGNYQVEWSVEGDAVTMGMVTIKSYTKTGCILSTDSVPPETVSFSLKATITNVFSDVVIITKNIEIFMEGVIMTKITNPVPMSICYAKGWAANENYMTEDEASAVTDIGTAFSDYKAGFISFTEFQYFTGVYNIPKEAFRYTSIKTIELPANINIIGEKAFYQSSILTMTLPANVITVDRQAFYTCRNLTEFTFPKTLKNIGYNILGSCINLVKVTLPDRLDTFDSSLFSACYALKEINKLPLFNGELPIDTFRQCKEIDTPITVPERYTVIGSTAFAYCDNLPSVILPEGIKEIKSSAFEKCFKLNNINIPSTLTYLGDSAFRECISIENIILPDGITNIGDCCFNLSGLKSFKIPASLTKFSTSNYGRSPFIRCNELEKFTADTSNPNHSVENGVWFNKDKTILYNYPYAKKDVSYVIPDTVKEIGESAFERYDKESPLPFTLAEFPSHITKVGYNAFRNTNLFSTLSFSIDGIELKIGAFYGSTELTELRLPVYNYKSSYYSQFESCEKLQRVVIKEGNETLFHRLFCSCTSLTDVTLPSSLKVLSTECFSRCTSLENINIPNGVTEIGDFCFYRSGIINALIPDTVQTIGINVFSEDIALKSIVLPAISVIKDKMLYKCTNLESISIKATTAPAISGNPFGSSISDYTGRNTYDKGTNILYVPTGATGYDTGQWLDTLCNPDKCGFTISYTL